MFVAAYGISVEKSNQCIFSTGKRASDKLLEQVHDFIISLGNEWGARCKRRGEILYIYGPNDPLDVRKISSYPSGSDKLRGVGGDVIYLEEAAFMSFKMFHVSIQAVFVIFCILLSNISFHFFCRRSSCRY